MLELILTLVFRCTGVCFTGTGVGESIYSTVDSCNSTIPVTGAPWRSGEDISRRCHPRCPVGRAPVGEGVEGGGGGRHPGVQEEGEGRWRRWRLWTFPGRWVVETVVSVPGQG